MSPKGAVSRERQRSNMQIDTSFDFRTEIAPGRDPDACSPTLRCYHKLLWSKALPDGRDFTLSDASWAQYLHHSSDLGEFRMTSDTIAATYTLRQNPAVRRILVAFPEEDHAAFRAKAYTIAGFLIFPANTPGRTGRTINQDRGCDPRISDRIDLTLECIRRHYLGQQSPLASTLARYAEFFALFGGFSDYVDFFLLNDLVSHDASTVRFLLPLNFDASGLPEDADAYRAYREGMLAFLDARSRRVEAYVKAAQSKGE
jgi:hypothetical protein